ncbi:hypothetical protein MTR_2g099320 [Medicago truncatula]|uniref:Uncharacterized protein n=1 Tax=Medicago truncatula TaxID=3880 RepID=G7IS06_MEDTR|nr:hypothetical protein MTR_2g099320 [Medicago truncatula]
MSKNPHRDFGFGGWLCKGKVLKWTTEGTKITEGTKFRRDLFRRDRKRREKKRIARQHKLKREKREKFFDNSRELLVCEIVWNEERHTGSIAKKWKYNVKVKSTMLPLEKWVCISSFYIRVMEICRLVLN